MIVYLPFSLTLDWALLASSGRTKLLASVVFTKRRPASIAFGVVRCTVFPEQVLKDVDRHVGADLYLADEVLAHYAACKDLVRYCCHGLHRHQTILHSQVNRDVLQAS